LKMRKDPMKRLARNNMLNIENIDSRGPPRNKNWPRGDSSEHREKHVKIKEVDKKDVGMMAGLIEMTRSSRGPKPRPEQKANPRRRAILVLEFLPLSSGVAKRVSRNPIAAKEVRKLPERTLVKRWT